MRTGTAVLSGEQDCAADGIIDADDHFEGFLSSASRFSLPDADAWMRRRQYILSVIKPAAPHDP